MSKGLPIVLSIPARFKKDRAAVDKGEKKTAPGLRFSQEVCVTLCKKRFNRVPVGQYPE